jgi:hypothetical protein
MTTFEQPDLFTISEPTAEPQTPAERFEAFHHDNPHVYATYVRLARAWVERTGRSRIGIGALTERVRWEIALTTSDADHKINNDHRAYYARLIMQNEPDLANLFELRTSAADDWIAGRAA